MNISGRGGRGERGRGGRGERGRRGEGGRGEEGGDVGGNHITTHYYWRQLINHTHSPVGSSLISFRLMLRYVRLCKSVKDLGRSVRSLQLTS